jgi:hypothetical protein
MHLVGKRIRTDIELDVTTAWRRARSLDTLLVAAVLPRQRGVLRGTHAAFMRMDEQRQVLVAARLNTR